MRDKFLCVDLMKIKKVYNEQRNRCVKLVRSAKKAHYSNLSIKDINGNKKFWKIVKRLFFEKVNANESITLAENSNIISFEIEIAEKLNAFFSNIVKEFKIKVKEDLLCDVSEINDPVESAIQKYKNPPTIQVIKETFDSNKTFSFDLVSSDTFFKEILSLDTKKATHSIDKPTKIVKENVNLFPIFVSNPFNESVLSFKFLPELKLADVKPLHKKKSRLEKTNYRPVSLLPNISKVFERCLHREISEYFETALLKCQCGFRKEYSTQDCLLAMAENCKKVLDQWNEYGALLNLSHDLIVAKLHAYGFSIESLKLTNSYLTERKQRVKINDQLTHGWIL